MIKKNAFYLSLIIIYLLFLMKDNIFKLVPLPKLNEIACSNMTSFYQEEYQNISKLLDINVKDFNITYSKILIRNIYDFYDKITIEKGTSDHFKKGNIVLNDQGLVGVITKVSKNSSEVSLLTNNSTNVSVKINNSYGILHAKDNKLIVENIKLDSVIGIGDSIYTSGLTEIPGNILIGTIKDIKKDKLELEYLIEVKPSVNFHNLNYVGVLK